MFNKGGNQMNNPNEFCFEISKASKFQQQTVKDLYRKFFCEEKNKLVLADEVGMGKTYVCRGLIENIKKDKKRIIYISPNDAISKQNYNELTRGFNANKGISANAATTRLSEITNFNVDESNFSIRSFSASVFFNNDNGNTGTEDERRIICFYLYSLFEFAKNSDDVELKAIGENNELFAELVISAFFKPMGNQSRYYLYDQDPKINKDYHYQGLQSAYRTWHEKITDKHQPLKKQSIQNWEVKLVSEKLKDLFDIYVPELKTLLKNNSDKSCYEIVKGQYQKNRSALNLQDVSDDCCYLMLPYYENTDIDQSNNIPKKKCCELFLTLRTLMNIINLKKIKPDLIILDEFHKYFNETTRKTLNIYLNHLCENKTKTLLVSATPYKMSSKSSDFISAELQEYHEDNDEASASSNNNSPDTDVSCFSGFSDLYQYISDKDSSDLSKALSKITVTLDELSKSKDGNTFQKKWNSCRENKKTAEKKLREYIVRTERHTLESGSCNYHHKEYNSYDHQNGEFVKYEADQLKRIVSVLGKPNISMMYVKMAPYPMSFSEGYQSLGFTDNVLTKKESYDSMLFWDGDTEPLHFRYQALKSEVIPNESLKKALWIPPSKAQSEKYSDEHKEFGFWTEINCYTKTLVFARHIMTTKSIAAIFSAQINNLKNDNSSDLSEEIFEFNKDDKIFICFKNVLKKIDVKIIKEPSKEIDKIAEDFTSKFYDYLKANKHVLLYAGVTDKCTLFSYCKDGGLQDVIEEYLFLLTKGYSSGLDDITALFESALKNSKNSVTYIGKNDEATIKTGFAMRFSDTEEDENQEQLQNKFNSPFYPFVLATTPIAQEGLNFQNYCHRVFHWITPVSPVDFEQQEGRINRYHNHAVRKSYMKYSKKRECWNEVFIMAATDEAGLSPHWIANVEDPVKIESCIVNQKFSKDEAVQKLLKKAINNYRVSLGYGISPKVLDKISNKASEINTIIDFKDIFLDLSPRDC